MDRREFDPQRPLAGLLVLDMSLYLAGPFASQRLQDFGARVIKIERPDGGDPSRGLYRSPDEIDSLLFHIINRGKESITLDMKNPADREVVFALIKRADVLVQNYRPGVAERLGFGYEAVNALNPRIVYASISGYGSQGPWSKLPGQDLLAQARSGIMWLSGDADDAPTPTGLALGDIYTGVTAAQGIMAALIGRSVSGKGALIETSLLETLIDLQFEQLAMYMNKGEKTPVRSGLSNANAYAPAPYGVYKTEDGYLALAMNPIEKLSALLQLPCLTLFPLDPSDPLNNRDEVKVLLATRLLSQTTAYWLEILQPADIWCSEVMDWPTLLESEQAGILDMVQSIRTSDDKVLKTTRLPLKLNGKRLSESKGGPALGGNSVAIRAEVAELIKEKALAQ